MRNILFVTAFLFLFDSAHAGNGGLANLLKKRQQQIKRERERARENARENNRETTREKSEPAPPLVQLSEAKYLGSGCPPGSVGSVLSPDQNEVSLLFDQFLVEAGQEKPRDSRGCRIQMELKISNGNYRLRVDDVDFRGAVIIPRGASASLSARHAILATGIGMRNPHNASSTRNQFNFLGPLEDSFLKVLEPIDKGHPRLRSHFTRCDDAFYVLIDATLAITTNRQREDALLTLDTVDASLEPNIVMGLDWSTCDGHPVRKRFPRGRR